MGYGFITRRVSLGNLMRVGLIIETLTHLSLALTTTPAVALVIMVVFGAHAFVWSTTSVTGVVALLFKMGRRPAPP